MSTESGKPANAVEAFARREGRIAHLEGKVDRLLAHLGADRQASNGSAAGAVAPVSQLQGQYGDPEIGRIPPSRWSGPSYEKWRASECPPDFLDVYADFLDWKADNPRPGKEQFARFDRERAGKCRRWAIEIREGRYKQPARRVEQAGPPPPDDAGTTWSSGERDMPPPPDDFGPPPGDDDNPF